LIVFHIRDARTSCGLSLEHLITSRLPDQGEGIDRLTGPPHFEVEVGGGGPAGRAGQGDHFITFDAVAGCDEELRCVAVHGFVPVYVVDEDVLPIDLIDTRIAYDPCARGPYVRIHRNRDVEPGVSLFAIARQRPGDVSRPREWP